jgi:hypothetical protein
VTLLTFGTLGCNIELEVWQLWEVRQLWESVATLESVVALGLCGRQGKETAYALTGAT